MSKSIPCCLVRRYAFLIINKYALTEKNKTHTHAHKQKTGRTSRWVRVAILNSGRLACEGPSQPNKPITMLDDNKDEPSQRTTAAGTFYVASERRNRAKIMTMCVRTRHWPDYYFPGWSRKRRRRRRALLLLFPRVPSVTQTLERIDNNDKGSFVT